MKDIKNYEGLYAVTSCGKVWSHRSKKFLKPQKMKNGYLRVDLRKDGERKNFLVHRLVAETYVPNPDNLETVDHIDGNKNHNYVRNLQWLTRGDNIRKAWNKSVKCIETGQIFNSVTIAAEELGLCKGNISNVCNGKRNQTGGYHFEFI